MDKYTKEFAELLKLATVMSAEVESLEAVVKAKKVALSAIHVRIGEIAESGKHLQVKS